MCAALRGQGKVARALHSALCVTLAFRVTNEQNIHAWLFYSLSQAPGTRPASVASLHSEVRLVDIDIRYEGDLHCSAEHGPSSALLATDAPVDNQGKGQAFSPTDLVATGLGTCMATVMGILARKQGYTLDGMTIHVKKHMTADPPRRIARLVVDVRIPPEAARGVDAEGRTALEHAAHTCPVRLSLAASIDVPVTFEWQA